jgi:hypothetical protein
MATKPTIKTVNASAMDILNVIRANASSTYQERIPEATQDNIREIGNAMLTYESTQNEFLNALVNRIARVIITSKSYQNPLRMFKKGVLEFGETIEEIFVNIARAHQFDPAVAEKEVFKREIPDVNAVFHKMNYQNFYKTTISNEQLRQAFLSYQGISDLIARIVDSLYTGSEFDEFLVMKQLIVDAANDGKMYAVTIPEVTPDNAKTIVAKIKGISNSMEFMSTTYNSMGVLNYTKKENQIFLIDAAFDAMIDVEVLASAFNMSKAEFMGQRVLIDNFGELTGVYAAIVDKDWFMVFDNWIGFTENYNGQGLYWNYFYHCWKTFSTSPFSNAVLFTTATTAVTGVTVTPPTTELVKGSSMQFTASVVTTGYVPKGVTWSVTGATDTVSSITPDGILTVPSTETNTTLTVTATSVYDTSKKGTSTVTLK